MTRAPWRTATAAFGFVTVAAAFTSLIWIYAWARSNTTTSDREQEMLIASTVFCCALLGAPIVLAGLARERPSPFAVVVAGAAGAFVGVAASAASTMLIAMAISPATDPGDFGRPLFPWSYVGAVVLSVGIGLGVAWSVSAREGLRANAAAVLLTVLLTAVAFGYLARGSSELNQCVVDDEFPLATDHVCSGY